MNDKEMLAFWKANEKPFGLCPEEAQVWLMAFYACNPNGVEVYHWGVGWSLINHHAPASPKDISRGTAYRIPADYQPAPKGRWVECEVEPNALDTQYVFNSPSGRRHFLSDAPGMVGFGGVRYEGRDQWARTPRWEGEGFDRPPLKPVAVRFWVEE